MKNKIKILFTLSLFICIFSLNTSFANETNKNISIYITEDFKKELYKPGDSDNLKFEIKNNTNNTVKIKKLYLSKKDDNSNKPFEEMSKYTNVVIKNNDKVVFKGLLKDLINGNHFNLNITLDPYQSVPFDMYIDIDKSMGNEAQNVYQELYISADYELHNDTIVDNDNNVGNDNNSGNTNSPNGNDSNNSENTNSPQTGDSNNIYLIFIMIGAIVLLLVINKDKLLMIKNGNKNK